MEHTIHSSCSLSRALPQTHTCPAVAGHSSVAATAAAVNGVPERAAMLLQLGGPHLGRIYRGILCYARWEVIQLRHDHRRRLSRGAHRGDPLVLARGRARFP